MASSKLNKAPKYLVNNQIKSSTVLVVDESGARVGEVPIEKAIACAVNNNLDLVQIAPGEVPVCKVLNYEKFLYQRAKSESKVVPVAIKEVQLSPNIDAGDYKTKLNRGLGFLQKGFKLRVVLRLRGRDLSHREANTKILSDYTDALSDVAKVVSAPSSQSMYRVTVVLQPL